MPREFLAWMWLRKFLIGCTSPGPTGIGQIRPRDVAAFLRHGCTEYKPGSCAVIGGALRSYFRFRALEFGDSVEALSAAIPKVARWRLDTVPKHLTPQELEHFLSTFDRQTGLGQRGFAIARCLVDLGLRACEVAAIQLRDVNWREGVIAISGGKSRRVDLLPIPASTVEAIVECLRKWRPQSDSRALFLTHRAPFRAPVTAAFVRRTVRQAFATCGMSDRYGGPHVLRRTAAQRMLCAGVTLKEIADILRHRSLDTTTLYTKVDLPRLASIVAPWPEER